LRALLQVGGFEKVRVSDQGILCGLALSGVRGMLTGGCGYV